MSEKFKPQICWLDATGSDCNCPKCYGCRRKRQLTRAEAETESSRLNDKRSGRTKGARVKPYDCPWCEHWHVGRDNKYRRDMQRYISYMNRRK